MGLPYMPKTASSASAEWSDSKAELVLSLPAGVASVELGNIKRTTVEWASTTLIRSPSAPASDIFSRTSVIVDYQC